VLPGLAEQFLNEAIAERYRQGADVETVQAEMAQDRDLLVALAFERAAEAAEARAIFDHGLGEFERAFPRQYAQQSAARNRIAERVGTERLIAEEVYGL
jgi:hypothetical protein